MLHDRNEVGAGRRRIAIDVGILQGRIAEQPQFDNFCIEVIDSAVAVDVAEEWRRRRSLACGRRRRRRRCEYDGCAWSRSRRWRVSRTG